MLTLLKRLTNTETVPEASSFDIPCGWERVTVKDQHTTPCPQRAMWVSICHTCHRHDYYCDEHLAIMDLFSMDPELGWACGSCDFQTDPGQSWREGYDVIPLQHNSISKEN